MKKFRLAFLFSLIISSLVFMGCESEDDEKMLSAQNCFNNLNDSDSGTGAAAVAAAAVCSNKLGSLSSPEAQLIRCGLELWVGGLNTPKIVTAFDAAEDAGETQKEAALIANLALTDNATADRAYNYCYSAGAAGMIYVSGLIKLGTYMETAGGGLNPDDYVDSCQGDGTCNSAANGQMLVQIGEVYCVGEAEENDVCQALAAAQSNTTDPATIMNNFLNQINY